MRYYVTIVIKKSPKKKKIKNYTTYFTAWLSFLLIRYILYVYADTDFFKMLLRNNSFRTRQTSMQNLVVIDWPVRISIPYKQKKFLYKYYFFISYISCRLGQYVNMSNYHLIFKNRFFKGRYINILLSLNLCNTCIVMTHNIKIKNVPIR